MSRQERLADATLVYPLDGLAVYRGPVKEPLTSRRESPAGRLARLGFADATRALSLIDSARFELDDELLGALGLTADPDLALSGLLRLLEVLRDASPDGADAELLAALGDDQVLRGRLLAVLGASAGFGDHLARYPAHWRALADTAAAGPRETLLRAVGADPGGGKVPYASAPGAPEALRVAYRLLLLRLAARDLTGAVTVDGVAAELADLAAAALEAGLAIARAGLGDRAERCRLAVIGMGKCGGRELNYVSDVDVIFVAEPSEDAGSDEALKTGAQLASGMMRACRGLWEVDAALRPEGKAGPLVRTLASHRAYYEKWAKTWEFQALLKARAVAGDLELGQAYADMVAPYVWHAASGESFVADVQAMRRRVEGHVSLAEADRELKLGPGGLRDVEFAVQLLQLVHGRTDPALRSGTTLTALEALSAGGYVGREDAAALAEAYRFLRRTEHLLQLYRLRRTHVLPDSAGELRRLGRAMGLRADPAGEFTAHWRRHAREVRRLHEKLFYRPLLNAVARLPDGVTLSPDAARERLEALGYVDPAGALGHIAALTSGVSRRAAIQRTILPVMLDWFQPDPDAGLLGFRKVSDAVGASPWYLRLLRDDVSVAERMARLLASSRYATELLLRAPEAVALLADATGLRPRTLDAVRAEALAIVRRHASTTPSPAAGAITAVRALRRRELFRLGAAELLGEADVAAIGEGLSAITAACLEAALRAATLSVGRGEPLPTQIAVIAMGRFGGCELGFGSDADVMFVHEPLPGAEESAASAAAHAVAGELRRLLEAPAPDPPLVIDPDLRPEGRQGPLVRTLASYAAYYRRWSSPWESQALLRAAPVAGDPRLGERFLDVIDPIRWGGVDDAGLREIRRLKARMESERLPRGTDPSLHVKLGPGGLSDVEWVAQLLQLRHGEAFEELRTPRTLLVLARAREAELLDSGDAEVLSAAWILATRIRNAIMLVRGRPGDVVPTALRERTFVAEVLGYPGAGELVEDYRRHARRARKVTERVFYAQE